VLDVLVPMRVDRTIRVAMFVLVLDVLVRVRMSDSAGMLMLVGMPFSSLCLCFHGNLNSLYTN